jgi:hypothetical protein
MHGENTFLQAANNFLRDSHPPRVSFVGFTRRPAAICRPLGRYFVTFEDLTAASSLGTILRSAPASNSLGPCSFHSRLATAAPSLGISCHSMKFSLRSRIFPSCSDRMEWAMASILPPMALTVFSTVLARGRPGQLSFRPRFLPCPLSFRL